MSAAVFATPEIAFWAGFQLGIIVVGVMVWGALALACYWNRK